MKKTLALCLGIFMLLGIVGATAQITATVNQEGYVPQITSGERFENAKSVESLVDPQILVMSPIKIGESVADRYRASCSAVRRWLWDNAVEARNSGKSVGDFVFDSQATDANGNPTCVLKRYAEKSRIIGVGREGNSKSHLVPIWENGTIVGYKHRYTTVQTSADWHIVDLTKPEQSYRDFVAGLDTTVTPEKIYATEDGDD